jgi:hypothetical protein
MEVVMPETIEQYKERILGYVRDGNPLEILKNTVEKIETLVRGASADKLQEKKNGKWSAAQILAHYAEGEIVVAYRLRMILSVNTVPIQAYDQDLWVNNAGYLIAKPELARGVFRELRTCNLALLNSLGPEQWDNYGMHSERGKESVRDLVRMISGHDLNHLKQLEATLKA